MTRTTLSLLLLASASASGCGSGRMVSSESPAPSAAPAYDPAEPTVAEPTATVPTAVAPPAPTVAPAPQAETTGYAPYGGQLLQMRRIGQWSSSGITAPARMVIRDDSSYARFWAGLGAGDRPLVDFTRDVVIAAAAGQRMTGGHSIAVDRVTRTGEGLAVEVVETLPRPECLTTQTLTQPVDMVVVAAADARTWSFSDRSVAQGCQ